MLQNPTPFVLALVAALSCPLWAQDPQPNLASWPRESIFYHVYVRSFADSNGDGQGDLPGLTSKLDYIQSLGVDGLLLLPVFQNDHDEYGGYSTTNYYHIEDDYGGDQAWDLFIAEALKRKLKVLLDLSINHISENHAWFKAVKADPNAPERQHFLWAGPPTPEAKNVFGAPAWIAMGDGPSYYAAYVPHLPSVNVRNPATTRAIIEVAKHWMGRGVDGFRLDSAKHIAEVDPARPGEKDQSSQATHRFWRQFMAELKKANPDVIAIAEIFGTNAPILQAYYQDGIDMVFDYPIHFGMVDAMKTGLKKNLALLVDANLAARPQGAWGVGFTENHDVPGKFIEPFGRSADLLGGNVTRLQSAALLLFSLPSTPMIYYGQEIGLRGGVDTNDAQKKKWSRNPMQWDASPNRGFTTGSPWRPYSEDAANVKDQDGTSNTLLATYRGVIAVRKSSPALTHGTYKQVPTDRENVFAFLRIHEDEKVLVMVNLSGEDAAVHLDLKSVGIQSAVASDRIFQYPWPEVSADNAGAYSVALPAYEGRWVRLD